MGGTVILTRLQTLTITGHGHDKKYSEKPTNEKRNGNLSDCASMTHFDIIMHGKLI